MKLSELIDMAKMQSGLSLGQMAKELDVAQTRISEWKKEQHQPSAGVLAYFADKAGLNVAETVMEIERTFDPRFTEIWERALGNLRAAKLAATPTNELVTSSMKTDRNIRTLIGTVVDSLDNTSDQVQIKAGLMAVLNAFPEEQSTIAATPQSGGENARGVAAQKPRLRKSLRT